LALGPDGKVEPQNFSLGKAHPIKGKQPDPEDMKKAAQITGVGIHGKFEFDPDNEPDRWADLYVDGLDADGVIDNFGCSVGLKGKATPIKLAACSYDSATCGTGDACRVAAGTDGAGGAGEPRGRRQAPRSPSAMPRFASIPRCAPPLTACGPMHRRTHMPEPPQTPATLRAAPPDDGLCEATVGRDGARRCCRSRNHDGLHQWRATDGSQRFDWG
jgi:hypothetical protein